MSADEIHEVAETIVYSSEWMEVREATLRWPAGNVDVYPTVRRRDFVVVLPWEEEGFWIVEQYRYPVRDRRWEFPQGGWPAGRGGSPIQLAALELSEETGHTAEQWNHLGRLSLASSFTSQAFDTYLATQLQPGHPKLEESELGLVSKWVSTAELAVMMRSGQFVEAASVAAYGLFLARVSSIS